jgi:hypothetical protein
MVYYWEQRLQGETIWPFAELDALVVLEDSQDFLAMGLRDVRFLLGEEGSPLCGDS